MGNWGRVNIGSGGGGGLNFKVIGGTSAPTSPKENTIWVNTAVAISGWEFSATAPTNPVAGMVWFKTNASSASAFNAIKKNGLWVYPSACQQYISGAWVTKTAKTWQNSTWADWWNGELYTPGNTWDFITGGYVSNSNTQVSVAFNDDGIDFSYAKLADTQVCLTMGKAVDLTDFKTLSLDVQFSAAPSTSGNRSIGLYSDQPTWQSGAGAVKTDVLSSGTHTLDITSVTGSYYIAFRTIGAKGKITRIKMDS